MSTLDPEHPDQVVKLKFPGQVCYDPTLKPNDPFAFEDLWQTVERRLHDAFRALDEGTVLSNEDQLDVLKECLALHFARSKTILQMSRDIVSNVLDDRMAKVRTDPSLISGTGLHPAGPEGAEIMARDLRQRMVDIGFTTEELVPERFIENFWKAKRRLKDQPVEIAVAEGGDFLIGDAPAQTLSEKGVGPLGGVSWDQAATVFMPLGPRHLIATAPASKEVRLDAQAVESVNRWQVARAQRHVMWHPESELEVFVRAVMVPSE